VRPIRPEQKDLCRPAARWQGGLASRNYAQTCRKARRYLPSFGPMGVEWPRPGFDSTVRTQKLRESRGGGISHNVASTERDVVMGGHLKCWDHQRWSVVGSGELGVGLD